ncbi:hypothetical protein GYMLUDRAFT_61529 [Collybiopsis luxurians FD-317 M1]|uniref:BTB domain-containing protein n=1 Tax=Collybiopsis luxurians FD-317 M1 TaxID=944289 RepID=A0A0D0BQ57_9AGAR|nr:hypothetical protein GYMLUDRAFT_61529 [Collybiopsis luxurians FD-317 M1]
MARDPVMELPTKADLVVQSSDGVTFYLHLGNLELLTGGFPSAETPTSGLTVILNESSEVLKLLFRFIYPQRYPDIQELDFDLTLRLAEAAEKYVVYAAIYACKFRLSLSRLRNSDFIESYPNELLHFAAKHNHYSMIVQLAPLLIDKPLSELVNVLPLHVYTSWSVHREHWLDALHTARRKLMGYQCQWWYSFAILILLCMNKPSDLKAPDVVARIVPLSNYMSGGIVPCDICATFYRSWTEEVKNIVNAIPPLTLSTP